MDASCSILGLSRLHSRQSAGLFSELFLVSDGTRSRVSLFRFFCFSEPYRFGTSSNNKSMLTDGQVQFVDRLRIRLSRPFAVQYKPFPIILLGVYPLELYASKWLQIHANQPVFLSAAKKRIRHFDAKASLAISLNYLCEARTRRL